MSLISTADQDRLRQDFRALTSPVTLVFFTQTIGCEDCLRAREVLDELPPLSPLITIEEVNLVLEPARAAQYRVNKVPAVALVGRRPDGTVRDSHIRFLGVPAGYEFISLIRAVLLVGGGPSMLSDDSRTKLAAIDSPMDMHVFSTPTCPHCPRAVTLAHEIAWANPHVTAYAIDATGYADLARRYRVTGVPKTIINDSVEIIGAVPEDTFVEQTLAGFAARRSQEHA